MSWVTGTLCGFAVQASSRDVEKARITGACVMRVDGSGQSTPIASTWPDNAPAEEIVAETTAMLLKATRAGIPLVGFGVAASLTVLDRECRRHDLPTLSELVPSGTVGPVVCGQLLDAQVSRSFARPSLAECCAAWDVQLKDAADAAWCAWSAAGLAVRIVQRTPSIARMELGELHARQAVWHRERCLEEAARARGNAAGGRTVDDQLDAHAMAKSFEAQAEHWPVTPFEQQEALT